MLLHHNPFQCEQARASLTDVLIIDLPQKIPWEARHHLPERACGRRKMPEILENADEKFME